jgi:hypothetical protein
MLGSTTQPTAMVDKTSDITARINRVKRQSERASVCDLDILVMGRYAHVTGVLPVVTDDGNPVEYRVLLGEGKDGVPVSSDLPHRIVGAGPDDDRMLLAPTRAGRIERSTPFRSLDVIVEHEDVDERGWLDLRAAIERCVAEDREMQAEDVDELEWVADGPLLSLDIGHLDPMVDWLVVRFEAREVVDRVTGGTCALHGNGRTFMVRVDPEARHGSW